MNKTPITRVLDEEESFPRTVFWGICCQSGKKYSQVVGQRVHITMAALEPNAAAARQLDSFVSLMVECEGCEYLLCNLQHNSIMQVNLNLIFDHGENLKFSIKGEGTVHLSGYRLNDDSEPCQPKASDVAQSPKRGQNQNLKKKSILSPPGVKKDETITISDVPDKEPPNEKVAAKKVKVKDQTLSDSPKKKESVAKVEDEPQSKEDKVKNNTKKAGAQSGMKRLWEALQESSDDDDDDNDDDDNEDEDEEASKDTVPVKTPLTKQLKKELTSKQKDTFSKNSLKVVDVNDDSDSSSSSDEDTVPVKTPLTKRLKKELTSKQKDTFSKNSPKVVDVNDDSDSSSSSDEDMEELNSSIGRTPMPAKKVPSAQSKSPMSSPPTKPENKDKNQKREMSNMSILKGHKGKGALEKSSSKKHNSGIEVKDIRIGSGPMAKPGKLVHLYYIGKLPNGQVFDMKKPTERPFSFRLGSGEVIKGLEMGLEGMKVGGKRKLRITSELGYGRKGIGEIPPNSDLYYVIELKAVN